MKKAVGFADYFTNNPYLCNMLRAYKYRIYPTEEQEVLFAKTFGCVRVVYNWGLDIKSNLYKDKKESIGLVALTNRIIRHT